ncbi:hypothetical protein [Streptomyces sp. TS71-3]|uniref:hypothetical protein n=1 Tax=Streptomyces sp. TS71-3 TaxID=2733862 RepID=UPI001B1A357A|nr:hypothetical protein [Streptomyces sp. TS71-3]GHJ36595.1 hypothetical protein Sm713_22040 [Streptomyces sp. TS71-3]
MNPRAVVTRCLVGAFALAGLVACGTPSPSDQARPARLYPFRNAAYYTAGQQRTIDQKLDRATATCMRTRGFSYRPQAPAASGSLPTSPSSSSSPSPSPSPSPSEPDNPYYLLDAATARTDGYGILPVRQAPDRPQSGAPAQPAADARYDDALVGSRKHQRTLDLPDRSEVTISVDGCVAKARQTVFGGDWDRLSYTVQALSNVVIGRTGKDAAVTVATRAWSSCMRRAGHPARKLADPRQQIYLRFRDARSSAAAQAATRAELTTAEADAACQATVHLRPVTQKAQQRIEQQVLTERYRRDLDEFRRRLRAVVGP